MFIVTHQSPSQVPCMYNTPDNELILICCTLRVLSLKCKQKLDNRAETAYICSVYNAAETVFE